MTLKKKSILENRKEEFLYYYNQKLSDREIGEKMGVFRKTVGVYRQFLKLPPNKKSPLSLLKNSFIELYEMGLSDGQIADKLKFSRSGISKYRSMLGLVPNNTISENDKVIIKDLEKLNYSNDVINVLIGQTPIKSNIEEITDREKAIKRNNKYYESYIVRLKPSKFFNNLYNIFYKNGIKTIPDYIYNYYTSESLAYQYMDDGSKICGTYKIATNCFTISELQKFQYFLLTKFNLKTTLHKDNGIYIRKESANIFKELVSPYIIDSMKYKLY